ncbi:type II toxin-antitoxin system RelE family toxin [Desulfonema magnum]|uniref:RelE/ParE toxin domain-containing protein n=1 Tax=Desulfonema magnum TaxID=45655 RepID=A0A975BEX3_9BACT|nr:hypothetical protein [Desulfonema magnum]QTA84166.1 RelE/ParE toxin domain-containing protein [Desulfonema magnum]
MGAKNKKWKVELSNNAKKNRKKLPRQVQGALLALSEEIKAIRGPVSGNWPNYGKLGKNRHHCHLKKGKPVYVCVWEVRDEKIRIISVEYVGTHEKAPY